MKHRQVAQDDSLMDIMRSIHVCDGVSFALEGYLKFAAASEIIALALDTCIDSINPAAKINAKFKVGDVNGNDRAITKLLLKKNAPCSCLKQTSRDLRKNQVHAKSCYGCKKLVEISKLNECNECRMVEYFSDEFQKCDWHRLYKDHN